VRQAISAVLALLLAGGLGYAIYRSAVTGETATGTGTVLGYAGSEKISFLEDPRVVERLGELGIELSARPAGSREMAVELDLADVDFAFPSSDPAAERIESDHDPLARFTPFVSPMAIASWTPVIEALAEAEVVSDQGDWYQLDMAAYLDLVETDTRWSDLGLQATGQPLITTTDVRRSNSAAMYLSLASYVANGKTIVTDQATAATHLPQLSFLFVGQGYVYPSSQNPFDNYLVRGYAAVPAVFIYEAQFVAAAVADPSPITDEMVLLYPSPTVYSNHTLLAFTEEGRALGEALDTDPRLQELATEHGFRTDAPSFESLIAEYDLPVLPSVIDTTEPPSFEVLEHMISYIEEEYEN
jgi:hypothetical protein